MKGIMRIAMAVPHLRLGDVQANVAAHIDMIKKAHAMNAGLVVFPELSLTGASCGDLFFQLCVFLQQSGGFLSHFLGLCPDAGVHPAQRCQCRNGQHDKGDQNDLQKGRAGTHHHLGIAEGIFRLFHGTHLGLSAGGADGYYTLL